MSYNQDWDKLLNPHRYDADGNLTEAARQQDVRMELNSLSGKDGGNAPADGSGGKSGGGGKLHIKAADLRSCGRAAETVKGDFMDADNKAYTATGDIAEGLTGFRSASAFATFRERWKSQMQHVGGVLEHNIANPMKNTATDHEANDIAQAGKQNAHKKN